MAALAHDAVQVINQAINTELCLSINGTSISSNDKEAMLTCLKKVRVMYYELFIGNIKFGYNGRQQKDFDNLETASYVVASLSL